MRELTSTVWTRRAAVLACLLTLAACSSTGSGSVEGVMDPNAVTQDGATQTATDESVDLRAYCPKTVMRAGTETYDVYPDKMKKDDPEKSKKLRFRASITDVVRECNYTGGTLAMKVGVAGRVITGPGGETGDFIMPIRIAVTQGDTVLYSQLHEVTATIPAGRANNNFTFVDSAIAFPKPDKENIIVYVGFDELRVDLPNAVAPKKRLN